MSVTKDEVFDLIKPNNDHLIAFGIKTAWPSRCFGERKTYLWRSEACPCSFVFLKDEVFGNGCDENIFEFSASRVSFFFKFLTAKLQSDTANSSFTPCRPNIGTCFALAKIGRERACTLPRDDKAIWISYFKVTRWAGLPDVVLSCFDRNYFILRILWLDLLLSMFFR